MQFCFGQLYCLHHINDKEIMGLYASFIKIFIVVNGGIMQARLNPISTSTKCSKLKATIWIVRLSNAIFSDWAQHGNLAGLNIV
jgi:hypothetical protein